MRRRSKPVTTQAIDALFKLAGRQLLEAVRQRYGLALAPIARELPTELPRMQLDLKRLDVLYLLADGTAVDLECQRYVRKKDIRRFIMYGLRLLDDEQVVQRVLTVVLCGPKPARLPPSGELGLGVPLRIVFVRLAEERAEVVLGRLQAVAASGQWSDRDRLDLLLLPLMPRELAGETVVREGLALAQQMPEAWQEQAIGGLLSLAYHAMSETAFDKLVKLMSGVKLLQKIYEEERQKGREQGLEEGRKEGRKEGREEGREEGLEKGLEGQRAMLRLVLVQRFAQIPPALEVHIAVADPNALRALLEQALVARSADELVAG